MSQRQRPYTGNIATVDERPSLCRCSVVRLSLGLTGLSRFA